jgi:hypothetical protein
LQGVLALRDLLFAILPDPLGCEQIEQLVDHPVHPLFLTIDVILL